jgi:hypothetical protein
VGAKVQKPFETKRLNFQYFLIALNQPSRATYFQKE